MSPSVTVRLLATQSDARLVELARHGHERAFEALVQRYRKPLLSYCRRALLPDARAEDALQQALLQAWLSLQRGAEVRDARAWLYRIVRNTALNALRSSGYDYAELTEALSGTAAPQTDLDRRIAVREALAGLAALPEQQREALMRTAVEGSSHADVAAAMGVSEGALRGLVHRARVTLRAGLTAVTPMPLASWAAGLAGHGGGAVAELAVGGGSAGLVGLLAKGGAVAVTAGALAVGVGAAERHRHHATPRHPHTARVAQTRSALAVADPSAAVPAPRQPSGSTGETRHDASAEAPHQDAPTATPRRSRHGDDGQPRRGASGRDDGRRVEGGSGGGPGPGTPREGERSGSGPGGGGSDGGGGDDRRISSSGSGSGAGERTGSGDGSGSSGSSDTGDGTGSGGSSSGDGSSPDSSGGDGGS